SPNREIVKYVEMLSMRKGERFALQNLFFEQSKSELLQESAEELDRLYNLMANNPTMEIELGGHTDRQGYRTANLKLSQQRAEAVKEYLMNRGISRKRVQAVGYGPDNPVAPNDTEENRAKNRRV